MGGVNTTHLSADVWRKNMLFWMDFDEKRDFLDGFWRKTWLSERILTKGVIFWTDVYEKRDFLDGI